MITADDLAWGNLSRFDAIVTGVRAYERRDDLRANNSRLLEYVFNGGTAIVQYNKFEFNDAQYGPYPAQGELEPRHRRVRAGEGARRAQTRCSRRRTRSAKRRGRTGCRSAGSISSARRIRATTTSCSSRIPFRTTRARRPARWSKAAVRQRTLGLRRARTCGGSCRPGTDGAYQLLANLISLGKAARAELQIADCRLQIRIPRYNPTINPQSAICNLQSHGSTPHSARVRAPEPRAVPRSRGGRRRRRCG